MNTTPNVLPATRQAAFSPATAAVAATLLCAALQLSGCVTTTSVAPIRNAWLGASYEEVVSRWGTPVRSTSFNDGRLVYTWLSEGSAPRGAMHPLVGLSASSGSGVGIGIGFAPGADRDARITCERTMIFQDARVVDQTWYGPASFCAEFQRK
jgi:hypothetical protein